MYACLHITRIVTELVSMVTYRPSRNCYNRSHALQIKQLRFGMCMCTCKCTCIQFSLHMYKDEIPSLTYIQVYCM